MQDLAFDTTNIRHRELETLGQYVTRLWAGQQGNLDYFAGTGNRVFFYYNESRQTLGSNQPLIQRVA